MDEIPRKGDQAGSGRGRKREVTRTQVAESKMLMSKTSSAIHSVRVSYVRGCNLDREEKSG